MNLKSILRLALRIAGAAILLQTLYFKFTGHPESVILFTKLGVEPWGRIGTGVFELITGLLLLITPTVFFGAMIGVGLMFGAIGSHLFIIGIESAGDGGQLFYLAITGLIICLLLALFYKKQGFEFLKRFFPSRFE
jgi:hypothetical protein